MSTDPRAAIAAADTALGIEFGSTRIKAVLIGPDHEVLATGGHGWENHLEGGLWSYSLDEVVAGLQSAYASLVADVRERYDVTPTSYGSIGISGMMHGYLAFDADDNLLAPFRTWRNTNTGRAADELTPSAGDGPSRPTSSDGRRAARAPRRRGPPGAGARSTSAAEC